MHGPAGAAARDPAIALGVNTVGGQVTNEPVAEFLGVELRRPARRVRRAGDGAQRSRVMGATIDISIRPRHPGARRSTTTADRDASATATLRAAAAAELDRPQPVRLLGPALRRRRRRCCATSAGTARRRRILEMQGITDPKYLDRRRDVDPVGRGRRAHPAAPARRQGVLAAGRRPAAAVHARGRRRARRRRRPDTAGPTSPSTSASRTRSRSSASCSARRRRTGSCSAAGPPTCCGSSTATSHEDLPMIIAAQDELDEYTRELIAERRVEAGRRPAHRPHRRRGGGRPAVAPTSW